MDLSNTDVHSYKGPCRCQRHAWVHARKQWLFPMKGNSASAWSKLPVSQPWWHSISLLNAVQSGRMKHKHSGQAWAPAATPNQTSLHANGSYLTGVTSSTFSQHRPRRRLSLSLNWSVQLAPLEQQPAPKIQCARCFHPLWTLRTQIRGHDARDMSSFLSCVQFYRWSFLSVCVCACVSGAFLGYSAISALNIASRDGLSLGRETTITFRLPAPFDSLLTFLGFLRCSCPLKDAPLRFRQRHIPALRSGADAKTAAYIRAVATQRERTGKQIEHLRRAARRTPGQTANHGSSRQHASSSL